MTLAVTLASAACLPAPAPSPAQAAPGRPQVSATPRQPHDTPLCQRSEGARRSLLKLLKAEDCSLVTPDELGRISAGRQAIFSDAYEKGDLDGLINMSSASIAGGDEDNPLPEGLFRDLRAVQEMSVVTAGDFLPGLLQGTGLLRRAYLANGYNSVRPPNTDTPSAGAPPSLASYQEELPPDLLCAAPWLAELHLWTPAVIPAGFFDCVPKLRLLEIGNLTPDEQNAAEPYALDLRGLPFLTRLYAPRMPGSGNGLRPTLLSPESPLYRTMIQYAKEGAGNCPRYIAGPYWMMCLEEWPGEAPGNGAASPGSSEDRFQEITTPRPQPPGAIKAPANNTPQ